MIEVFRPLPAAARSEQRSAYRQYLIDRDGAADFDRRTLSRREERMAHFIEPPARLRRLDRALFDAQYAQFDPARATPQELLFLLAMLKLNAAEEYGVRETFAVNKARMEASGDDLEMRILLEETYHTRILLSASTLYGLSLTAPYVPPTGLRVFIAGLAMLPQPLSRPILLAGEILGSLLLLNMLEFARTQLSYDPELRDGAEERIIDVLVDELGHMSFNRMHCGAIGFQQTKLILQFIVASLRTSAPEIGQLGLLPIDPANTIDRLLRRDSLPETVRKQAFLV